jgi:hypothetical protein
MRKGRFSVNDISFIEQNCEALSVEAISKKLDRDPTSVRSWIKKNIGFSASQKKEAEGYHELKEKPYYRELLKQFTSEELEMFDFHFKKLWSQFKEDVFHTEEIQIVDTIKLEILMNRILCGQQKNVDQISIYEQMSEDEKLKPKEHRDRDYIMNLDRQIATLRAAQETLSKDYKDLQARKATTIKDLKGTREQRIKSIEDSKQTFASLVKRLTIDPEFRQDIGMEMEKMRLAAQKEKERLSEYSKYEDGAVDRPFLSDNIKDEE